MSKITCHNQNYLAYERLGTAQGFFRRTGGGRFKFKLKKTLIWAVLKHYQASIRKGYLYDGLLGC